MSNSYLGDCVSPIHVASELWPTPTLLKNGVVSVLGIRWFYA
jgi:hypothetical protein